MARKTVKVEIRTDDPASLVALIKAVAAKQAETSNRAVAAVIDTASFAARAAAVATLQQEIEALDRQLQEKTGNRDRQLGIAQGQDSQTAGTLLFDLLKVRGALLAENRGNENALETWGFNVTLGIARTPGPRAKAAAS